MSQWQLNINSDNKKSEAQENATEEGWVLILNLIGWKYGSRWTIQPITQRIKEKSKQSSIIFDI